MDAAVKSFCDEIDKVSIKDATAMLVGMLAGPRAFNENEEKSHEFAASTIALAKVGMIAVLGKSKIVPLLLEGATPNDDTALEDDLLITKR
jgi:hypothetical protein